ncbi:hypothetical protein F4779DRAFT_631233 [Xylariaceae sp. FL0662B]|nr:hypothetical protein F4779DRAFT_631233 [Xylariaceae sp. FL0662B]
MPDQRPCYLGALAPELIDHILFQLDSISALGNFITSCSYVHECFKRQQEHLVYHVLSNELGPVLVDARFLFKFPYADPGDSGHELMAYWDGLHTRAELYRGMLNADRGRRGQGDEMPSPEELTRLCHTLHEMNFLARTYVTAHQQSFSRHESPAGTAPLSRTERLRVLRAFYRRQIVCNAWAPTKRGPEIRWMEQDVAAISNTSDHQGVPLGLFASFEAWELQQIDHVNDFIARLCTALLLVGEGGQEAGGLLSPAVVHRPNDEADFGKIFSHMDELTRYLRSHPMLAEAALRSMPSLPRFTSRQLLDAAPAYSQLLQRYCLPCLRYAWQANRFDSYPDPVRDANQQQQQQQESGEEGSRNGAIIDLSGDNVDLPPFGWVDALDGHYVNCFGEALHYEVATTSYNSPELSLARLDTLKLWVATGFTLWDRWRVEAIKELDQMRLFHTGWIVQELRSLRGRYSDRRRQGT